MNQTDIIILILGGIIVYQQIVITRMMRKYNNLKIDVLAEKEGVQSFLTQLINTKLDQCKKETLWAREAQDMLDNKESVGNLHISDECYSDEYYKAIRKSVIDEIFYVGKEITSIEDPGIKYGGKWEHPNIRDNTLWKRTE